MYESYLQLIENTLSQCLPHPIGALEIAADIISYSLEGGGKRVRPLLCLLFCEAAGGNPENARYFAAAIEYVHTYSLIHDDMPCMDNDDFRRSKPTVHRQFGEGNALLIGDAMLTEAFMIAAKAAEEKCVDINDCLRAIRELSFFSGLSGMVGGQILDIASEGKALTGDMLLTLDALKTGGLIEAACVLGCIAGGADNTKIEAARSFGKNLGLAFQITDDLLEYENDQENSDERNQKATYISVFGYERSKEFAEKYTDEAIRSLNPFGQNASAIITLANRLLHRRK